MHTFLSRLHISHGLGWSWQTQSKALQIPSCFGWVHFTEARAFEKHEIYREATRKNMLIHGRIAFSGDLVRTTHILDRSFICLKDNLLHLHVVEFVVPFGGL